MNCVKNISFPPRLGANEHAVGFDGPAGRIEGVVAVPDAGAAVRAVAIVCHPHPMHGGSLNNKVARTIAHALCDLGALVIRFNFRGVGGSAGEYDEGIGETQDLLAVIAAARAEHPGCEVWLAGFSFGAYVALRATRFTQVDRLITVAPPVNIFNLAETETPACPWLLVQGKADELVPYKEVLRWTARIYPAPEAVFLDGVCHYFHGKLSLLQSVIEHAVGHDAARDVIAGNA